MWIPAVLLLAHLFCAISVQRRLNRSVHFGKTRVLNTILLWLVPYFWAGLLFYLTRKSGPEIMLQDKEKTIRENWGKPLGRSNWTSTR